MLSSRVVEASKFLDSSSREEAGTKGFCALALRVFPVPVALS